MNRPTRRRSALAQSSPFDPPAETAGGSAPVPPANAEVASSAEKRPSSKPRKITVYQDPADTERMRGAMVATIPFEGFMTLSKFVQTAIMEKVERLEQQYNNGEQFPGVGPGVIPAGRPMGE